MGAIAVNAQKIDTIKFNDITGKPGWELSLHKDSIKQTGWTVESMPQYRISEVEYNFLVVDIKSKGTHCILCDKPLGIGEVGLFANKLNSSGQLCINFAHGKCLKIYRQ